jgi:hypothetical protein
MLPSGAAAGCGWKTPKDVSLAYSPNLSTALHAKTCGK